jgi:SAM-dependent methyltransferase
MSYNEFAYIYDRLMKSDINYDEWVDYIENIFIHYGKDVNLAADLACGTGNFTIPLAKRGYDMIGVDVSEDMLNVARDKAGDSEILFLNQNIADIDLYGTVDAFLCMIDGVNYILTPNSFYEMARKIRTCFLEPDGLFIFDISTRHKLKNVIGNNTFVHNAKDIFYSWQNRYIESKQLSDMYLNFFVKRKNGLYERFEERHIQRAYSQSEIIYLLRKAGFTDIDVFAPLTFDKPDKDAERIVFAARGGM